MHALTIAAASFSGALGDRAGAAGALPDGRDGPPVRPLEDVVSRRALSRVFLTSLVAGLVLMLGFDRPATRLLAW
jgi:hypothetical protein